MWIYKITNIQNNKVYIGQSIRPVNQRFRRHINDAINNKLDTYFARAIRKYGKDNFYIKIIDKADNQKELNLKEIYWIKYYKATNEKYGYNETEALNKCGGNTYKHKNNQEMEVINFTFPLTRYPRSQVSWLMIRRFCDSNTTKISF